MSYPIGSEQFLMEPHRLLAFIGKYVGELHFGLRMRVLYLDMLLQTLGSVESILDVGCARGQTAFFLARKFPAAHVFGIDIDPKVVEHCRCISEKLGLAKRVAFGEMDISLDRPTGTFGLIVCMDVIEYISDWQGALQKMIDALEPGGSLIIHTRHRSKYLNADFGARQLQKRAVSTQAFNPKRSNWETQIYDGFSLDDFCVLNSKPVTYQTRFTFGSFAMFLHSVFEIYRGKRRYWHFLLTPLLTQTSKLEMKKHLSNGGGILVWIRKS